MKDRGFRSAWTTAVSTLILVAWTFGVGAVAWRGLGKTRSKISHRLTKILSGEHENNEDDAAVPAGPLHLSDPRLYSLRMAADSWKRSTGPRRGVVDQVWLVPDVAAFLQAIAVWDERSFFPILIDEPRSTLPFLRAFRPARVVRFAGGDRSPDAQGPARLPRPPAGGELLWSQAQEAVARAWSNTDGAEPTAAAGLCPPKRLGPTPPGVVLSTPEAPMLAGAVALAAGRFQPLVHLRRWGTDLGQAQESARKERFQDTLTTREALIFARIIELHVASIVPQYKRLGDDCDFLTMAGEWPYRYMVDTGQEPFRGIFALDDLIGRLFDPSVRTGRLDPSRRRWAYTGRLLGDPAASVASAMSALFLQPNSALLWDTYTQKRPWSDFSVASAADDLNRALSEPSVVTQRSGPQASLADWHRTVGPFNRFGMVMLNSFGGPDWFNISGGLGHPSDIPRGLPASVAMIHSFSAADPSDGQTIAGRWLAHGAFTYYGGVQEPFLRAFRTPGLVAALLAEGMPLVAALRQCEDEPFGFPWRLAYLGDPLYRVEVEPTKQNSRSRDPGYQESARPRITPAAWGEMPSDHRNWRVTEIKEPSALLRKELPAAGPPSQDARFQSCLDAAIRQCTRSNLGRDRTKAAGPNSPADDWRRVLLKLNRDAIDPESRPRFDDLLIDALESAGATEELMARLAQIPASERGPQVWYALETGAVQRLARLLNEPDAARAFHRALDLWDEVIRLDWPASSHFPGHFSERVGTLAENDAERSRQWLGRLRLADEAMAKRPDRNHHTAVISAEQARAKARLGGLGASR